eukprot:c20988_g2_i2.p1 GENE.c20988_g2_i2~~c20988_g2_i2.p1  ORF type:complete len:465 (+),score=204.58 c20988_g2_i2:44-1396(+)
MDNDKFSLIPPKTEGSSPNSASIARGLLICLVNLSLSFLFCFTAFGGVQNLESSLDLGDVSGTTAVAILYICFTVACLLGPAFIQKFGSKTCILAQELLFGVFIASQIHPLVYTCYPAAALVGIGASGMWTGQGEYVSYLAKKYAQNKGIEEQSAQGLFQGIFFCIFQCSQVIGNLISSLVISSGGDSKPSDTTKTTLFTIYCVCIAVGVLILIFGVKSRNALEKMVDSEPSRLSNVIRNEDAKNAVQNLGFAETMTLMIKPKMFLLLPLFIANGLEYGFLCGDFTNSVVKNSLGANNIGYAMAFCGGMNAVSSLILGKVSDSLGRPKVCLLGFLCNSGCVIYLLVCDVASDAYAVIFILAFFWAVGDAVWNTIISAMLGACFEKDDVQAAFSNFKMWQSIGVAAAFFYSDYLDLTVKLWLVLGFLVAGIVLYFVNVFFFGFEKKRVQNE